MPTPRPRIHHVKIIIGFVPCRDKRQLLGASFAGNGVMRMCVDAVSAIIEL